MRASFTWYVFLKDLFADLESVWISTAGAEVVNR
jgi:hypothetical protein